MCWTHQYSLPTDQVTHYFLRNRKKTHSGTERLKKKTQENKGNKANFSPCVSLQSTENTCTCLSLYFGISIWNSKHLDDSVYQIVIKIQGAGMLSSCPTHTAADKLFKLSASTYPSFYLNMDFVGAPTQKKPLQCKT